MSEQLHPLSDLNGRPPGTTSWNGSITEAGTEMRSYYGRPILKEPTWTWEIPAYFFAGGLAGASAVLSSAARVSGNETLARRALYIGAVADLVSPALLISDLGRPERFHHMLRVVKVTSPMNLGSWVLLVNGGATTTAALLQLLDKWKPLRVAASIVSALAGPPLATYTGVLIADTAIPVWHEGRHELPWIFGGSAAASAGAAAAMFVPPRDAGPARRLAIVGVLAEGVLMQAMELRLGKVGEVYHEGAAGKLSWAAKGLAAAGAALLAKRGRKSRASAVVGGTLVCAGEVCLRWAVYKAGFQSARDPKYVVESQRERIEQDGTKATTKPKPTP
jgi:formate-dependent nitrite reductase membrane component NrfD